MMIGSDEKRILRYIACVGGREEHRTGFAISRVSVEQRRRKPSRQRRVPIANRKRAERSCWIARGEHDPAIDIEQAEKPSHLAWNHPDERRVGHRSRRRLFELLPEAFIVTEDKVFIAK